MALRTLNFTRRNFAENRNFSITLSEKLPASNYRKSEKILWSDGASQTDRRNFYIRIQNALLGLTLSA
jgi:hypothetical protein